MKKHTHTSCLPAAYPSCHAKEHTPMPLPMCAKQLQVPVHTQVRLPLNAEPAHAKRAASFLLGLLPSSLFSEWQRKRNVALDPKHLNWTSPIPNVQKGPWCETPPNRQNSLFWRGQCSICSCISEGIGDCLWCRLKKQLFPIPLFLLAQCHTFIAISQFRNLTFCKSRVSKLDTVIRKGCSLQSYFHFLKVPALFP